MAKTRRGASTPKKIPKRKSQKQKKFKSPKDQSQNLNWDVDILISQELQNTNIEKSERGYLHDSIQSLVRFIGSSVNMTIKSAISLINRLALYVEKYSFSASAILLQMEQLFSGSRWIGQVGFEALFSLHPNIIGPLLSTTIGSSIGYLVGGFVGRALWPSSGVLDSIYSILTFGTNVSIVGLSSALVAAPISAIKLSSTFGNLADTLMLQKVEQSESQSLSFKLVWVMVSACVLAFVFVGATPSTIVSLFAHLTGALAVFKQVSIFSTLNTIFNIYQIKQLFDAGDYKGVVMKTSISLFLNLMMNSLFGTPIDVVADEVSTQVVYKIVEQIKVIEPPQPNEWKSVASYLSQLVKNFLQVFGSSGGGIVAAWICAGCFSTWVCWSFWKRFSASNISTRKIDLNVDLRKELDQIVGVENAVAAFRSTFYTSPRFGSRENQQSFKNDINFKNEKNEENETQPKLENEMPELSQTTVIQNKELEIETEIETIDSTQIVARYIQLSINIVNLLEAKLLRNTENISKFENELEDLVQFRFGPQLIRLEENLLFQRNLVKNAHVNDVSETITKQMRELYELTQFLGGVDADFTKICSTIENLAKQALNILIEFLGSNEDVQLRDSIQITLNSNLTRIQVALSSRLIWQVAIK